MQIITGAVATGDFLVCAGPERDEATDEIPAGSPEGKGLVGVVEPFEVEVFGRHILTVLIFSKQAPVGEYDSLKESPVITHRYIK